MKIGIITYAFALVEPLDALLFRLLNETEADVYLFQHGDIEAVDAICSFYAHTPRVHLYPYRTNRGLARSCNEGLIAAYERDGCDVALTINDDVLPGRGDIERIAQVARAHSNCAIATPFGGDHQLACAAITKQALETIGYFDEQFAPAYYEDTDWLRRARLAGLDVVRIECSVTHRGSGSLPHVPKEQHHKQFRANRSRYIAKWGGDRGEERWSVPFNNPAFGLKIGLGESFEIPATRAVTDRIRLRPPCPADDALLVKWHNDPVLRQYFFGDDTVTPESHQRWMQGVLTDPCQRIFVIEVIEGNVPIGTTSLLNIDATHGTAEYGRLKIGDRRFLGCGYGYEAEVLLLRYAFEALGLRRVYGYVLADNERVLALHEKTGFQIEGYLRRHIIKRGECRDVVVVGLLRDDFMEVNHAHDGAADRGFAR